MAADAVGGILLAGVTLYAVLGGADFGGGLWDLLAGGDRQGAASRALIDESITPVWEANHVWLVFDLVIFWTAFPRAFAAVMTALALPLWLALAGIVLRGAGFAFRKELSPLSLQRAAGAAFAFSSLVTPFFMGTVVGAIATGAVPAGASRASLAAWTSPTALLAGFLFTAACGYLAAVYLAGEAARRGDNRMQAYFTRRARVAAIVAGALSLATLAELSTSGPALYTRLTGRALPLMVSRIPAADDSHMVTFELAACQDAASACQLGSAVDERPVVEVRLGQDLELLVVLQHVDPGLAVALLEQDVLRAHDVAGVEVLRVGPRPYPHVLVLRAQRGDDHGGALVLHVRQQALDQVAD
jgi:cytochrome d ubiquinol oxidase subunit II